MQDIKFRAWRKSRNEMFKVLSINFFYEKVEILSFSALDEFESYTVDMEEIELLQYTGVKDMEGKEIFEGDIVYVGYEGLNGYIAWDRDTCRFNIILPVIEEIHDFDEFYGHNLVVIGNMYENPKLVYGNGR